MRGAYTMLGRPTTDALVEMVNGYMEGGWMPQGAPFQAAARKGSATAMHANKPQLMWFPAMILPPADAAQYLQAAGESATGQAQEGGPEAETGDGPGRQALGTDEYAEAQAEAEAGPGGPGKPRDESGEKEPITIVAGMGRCGTSLVMKMLAAAGMPTPGAGPPGYERIDIRDAIGRRDYTWCPDLAGGALKILGPYLYPPPPPEVWPCRIIYLQRNLEDQARSWLEYRLRMAKRPNPPPLALFERPKDEDRWIAEEKARLKRTNDATLRFLNDCGQPW